MSMQTVFRCLDRVRASRSLNAVGLACVIFFLLLVLLAPSSITFAQAPQPTSKPPSPSKRIPEDPFTVYLPLAFSDYSGWPGINGRVTQAGALVNGLSLEMRFYDGFAWSSYGFTTTNADGRYAFVGAPSLGSGQAYYVRYINPGGTYNSRVWFWYTPILPSYMAGSSVALSDFDIADIPMTSPPGYSVVNLPTTFQWTRRTATTTDSYEFDLFDPADGNPAWWTAHLGYVSSYTLNSLPGGFSPGVPYGWDMWVYAPDGGYGESYYYRPVAFANTGLVPILKQPSTAKPLGEAPPPR